MKMQFRPSLLTLAVLLATALPGFAAQAKATPAQQTGGGKADKAAPSPAAVSATASPSKPAAVTPAVSPTPTPAPVTAVPLSDGADARAKVLELAGAFGNEGYKTRDGFWFGMLEPNKPVFLEVNLFAGNLYWFCVGSDDRGRKLSVTVYDETGTPREGEIYQEGPMAATGWVADASGKYFIRLELLEGTTTEACFLYAYK